ncbi:MAG: primosomal protein N' [Candidatus Melainabacteria bacterium]
MEPAVVYAEVLVRVETKALDVHVYTYHVPEDMSESMQVGVPVLVPFGKQTAIPGLVVAVSDEYQGAHTLRDIQEVMDDTPLFDAAYYDFLQWVARYTATPLPMVLACALPAGLMVKTTPKYRVASISSGRGARGEGTDPRMESIPQPGSTSPPGPLSSKRRGGDVAARVLAFLQANPKKSYTAKYLAGQILQPIGKTQSALRNLLKDGLIEHPKKRAKKISPDPRAGGNDDNTEMTLPEPIRLTEEQTAAIARIDALGRQPVDVPGEPIVLFGVTGSGKTEVYLSLAREVLARGQTVMVLVPEIALTSQIARRFVAYFGEDNVALWHSQITPTEKHATWLRMAEGRQPILIAARSGIWAPMMHPDRNLGLILIDEAHDDSFKQDAPEPRYDARVLAQELSARTGAPLVLGSATPSVDAFYRGLMTDRVVRMTTRYGGVSLPEVRVVNMSEERMNGNRGLLSRTLVDTLKEKIVAGEQAVILMNRRGYYTQTQCTQCDAIVTCPNCAVSLIYHRTLELVRCHYCGHQETVPTFCSVCASSAMRQTGVGTQRVEAELAEQLPDARIVRLDSDVMRRRDEYDARLGAFARGEADILLGTQMVAKGLDIHNVTTVGVLAADSTFSLPDFRSAERAFQLLTQVAGRAGRGQKPGAVIVQAVNVNHPVIAQAQAHDYEGFYVNELPVREALNFPPFCQLFRFIISAENEAAARQFAHAAMTHLSLAIQQGFDGVDPLSPESSMHLVGPASCVIARIQKWHRFHFIVKNRLGVAGHQLITDFYRNVTPPTGLRFLLDIAPMGLV